MYSAPCAKFTIRMMPKISVRPTPRKNSSAACDSALTDWVRRKAKGLMARACRGEAHVKQWWGRWTSILVGRLVACRRGAVARERGDHLGHRRVEPWLPDHPHHEAPLHALGIAFPHDTLALTPPDS